MVKKFLIPKNADINYPIQNIQGTTTTNSWFDFQGEMQASNTVISDRTVMRCKLIKLTFNDEQKKLLKEWFALYAYTYNLTVKHLRGKTDKKSFYPVRDFIKHGFNSNIKARIAACKVPSHKLDNAVKDVITAYKSSFALHKGKKKFRIRFKKANAGKMLTLEASAFSKAKNSFSQKMGVVVSDIPIRGILHDSKLVLRNGKYMLFTPENRLMKACTTKNKCISLDPGLRTFQTGYCDDGKVFKIGNNFISEIGALAKKINNNKPKKFNIRIRDKIKHKVDDMHWKTANMLCKMTDKILLGNISTASILQGNLSKFLKPLFQTLSHYTFSERLQSKCEEYRVEYARVDESYTSKTCGGCSALNETLGASKVFTCSKCSFTIDRDVNGARNIMIKNSKKL